MLYNSMTARFTDSNILKAIIDNSNERQIAIISLDTDGEEVVTNAYLSYPLLKMEVVNNRTIDVTLDNVSKVAAYGILKEEITIKAGETKIIYSIFGTQDGSTYVFPISGQGVTSHYAASNPLNCVIYGDNIVATDLDISKERYCKITVSD